MTAAGAVLRDLTGSESENIPEVPLVPPAERRAKKRQRQVPPDSSQSDCPSGRLTQPSWHGKHGAARLVAEFEALQAKFDRGSLPQLVEQPTAGRDNFQWRLKLHNLDDGCPGGRQLNSELCALDRQHGQAHLLLEAAFPQDYPDQPPVLRIVTPRCIQFTGSTTRHGAICMLALTPPAGPGTWRPDMCFETILASAIRKMQQCEPLHVSNSSTGLVQGGGPLRVALANPDVVKEYDPAKAFGSWLQAMHSRRWTRPLLAAEMLLPGQRPSMPPSAAPAEPQQPHTQQAAQQQMPPQQPPVSLCDMSPDPKFDGDSPQVAALQIGSRRTPKRRKAKRRRPKQLDSLDLHILPTVPAGSSDTTWEDFSFDIDELFASLLPTLPELISAGLPRMSEAPLTFDLSPVQPCRWSHASMPTAQVLPSGPPIELTDDSAVEPLEATCDDDVLAALEAMPPMVWDWDISAVLQPDAPASTAVEDAQAQLQAAHADNAQLKLQLQAVEDERRAAAAAGVPSATRPEHWQPARDRCAVAEYVTLDLASEGHRNEEVEAILKAVERCGTVDRVRVVQIDRVQNPRLWTKYVIRRNEVAEVASWSRCNERLLFHGSNPATLALITCEGFDIRVSDMQCTLGAGSYFAEHLSYSLDYLGDEGGAGPAQPARVNMWARVLRNLQPLVMKAQRELQQAQTAADTARQTLQRSREELKAAKDVYDTRATEFGDALTFHKRCAAFAEWDKGISSQMLERQRTRLAPLQLKLRSAIVDLDECDAAAVRATTQASAAQQEVARLQEEVVAAQRRAASAVDDEASPWQSWDQPWEPGATPAGRQSSTLAAPAGAIMVLLCHVTLGRIMQGRAGLRRPPADADSTTANDCGYAVYDNTQAYPEYVLWLKPE